MNNNLQRINKQIAILCKHWISIASEDLLAKQQICRGGGYAGGILTRLLMTRPIANLRISQAALAKCIEHNVLAYDFFICTESQLRKKYGHFFKSNEKHLDKQLKIGHYVTGDHNVANRYLIQKMLTLYESNPDCKWQDFRKLLNQQSYDLITVEENAALNQAGLQYQGEKATRDQLCSPKIIVNDLWLTPQQVIDDFFQISGLDRNQCWDPCASDGRWLKQQGWSTDVLPMSAEVEQQDFLTTTKAQFQARGLKHIVGNPPFSLLKAFVNHALDLAGECYFLVNGDTIFKHFPNQIKTIYIFNGLEGNQKDYRSRCEFDVPFLIKSALWCCIVHITKAIQPSWTIEHHIDNQTKRDGKHIALGRNTFINCHQDVINDPRIKRIFVKSAIDWKNGKKIIVDDEVIDLRNFNTKLD